MIDFTYYAGLRKLRLLHKKLDPWGAVLPTVSVFLYNCDRDIELTAYAMKRYMFGCLAQHGDNWST